LLGVSEVADRVKKGYESFEGAGFAQGEKDGGGEPEGGAGVKPAGRGTHSSGKTKISDLWALPGKWQAPRPPIRWIPRTGGFDRKKKL